MSKDSLAGERLRANYRKYVASNPLFRVDAEWLKAQDPLLAITAAETESFDFTAHYLGRQQARVLMSSNPFFDWALYDRRTNYLGRGGRQPIEYDYLTNGIERGAHPSWIFRPEHFQGITGFSDGEVAALKANYGDLHLAFLANIEAFERAGPLFSFQFYRMQSGATVRTKRELLRQYLMGDHAARVHGTPLFDDDWYLARYAGKLSVGSEPHHAYRSAIHHFLGEGLQKGFSPIPDFDAVFYAKTYPDVKTEISAGKYANAIDHFLGHLGDREHRKPNPYFDPAWYLAEHPDAKREMEAWGFVHPLEHFLHVGARRGWRAGPPLVSMDIPEAYAKAAFEKRAQLATHQYLTAPRKPDFTARKPDVSLVIPVSGSFNLTGSLLAQIAAAHGPGARTSAQVIVVDNGSTDRTVEAPSLFPGVEYVRVEEAIGYTAACNLGAARASAPIIVFLNNDIELGHGAIDALAQALREDESLGAVGPKIVMVDGTVQEAGGIAYANGRSGGFGRGEAPERHIVNIARDVDYVSGCALAVRRELFERLGGFDEQFSPGYFEDVDLCLRLWEAGRRVRYLPHASLTHYEYGTYSKGRPKEISEYRMFANKAKYLAKHADLLVKTGASISPPDPAQAAFRRGGWTGKYALLIEDLAPDGRFGSGFVRSEDVVRELLAGGWRVTVYANEHRAGEEHFLDRYRGQVDVRYRGEIELGDLLQLIGPALDLAWVCRTHNIHNCRNDLLKWRRGAPHRRLVADTEALASLRTAFPGQPPAAIAGDPRAVKAVAAELEPAAGFDRIVCVNAAEAALAKAAQPQAEIGVLGHRFDADRTAPGFDGRSGFVFCGAVHEAQSPNMDSLRWFCRDILPRIRERLPNAEFAFVGYVRDGVNLPKEVRGNATVLGRADDLKPVFDARRVFVAPTRLAAGVPHKVQQAMALGIPCVVTENLVGQLESGEGLDAFLAASIDAEDFAAKCVALHTDAKLWARVQADAWSEIERNASASAFSAQIDSILGDVTEKAADART
ncbi:MAG: glycosyltransferase [Caulobacteraceae bacterium]